MKLFRHVFLLLACVLGVTGLATVTSTTYRAGPYTCTALPIVLSVQFPFNSASELRVINLGQNGTSIDPGTVLTLNSDYSVSGGGYNASTAMQSGSVTVVSTGAHSVAVNDVIVILRNVPVNQPTAFVSGPLTAAVVEKGFDRASTVSQEISETLSRALRFEEGEILDGTLNRTARSGKLLGFDANGNIEFSTGGSGGGGTTYAAGAGLQLSSNEFSVLPDQSFNSLTVTDPINADLAGNADTATALETARTINGISFDGTANITVPAAAGTLTGTSLASNVVSSSLTSIAAGTIGTMAVQNSNAVSITGGTITGATVTGLADGMNPSDAVNLSQLQGVSSGIILRTGVVAATVANITLSAPQTIDGQAVIAGNRVLVKNQTAPEENGIYDVAAGAWSRSSDSNTASELLVGYTYFVSAGTVNGASTWSINVAPTVLGTDPVEFVQFSASQAYSAGTGLGLAGNVFSISPTQSGLTLTSSAFNGTIGATTPSSAAFTTQTTTGNSFFANLVVKANQINEQSTNGTSSVLINYDGYAGGTTQFRDTSIYDGKNALVGTFTGSTKSLAVVGGINSTTIGATTPSTGKFSALTTTSASVGSTAVDLINTSFGGHQWQFFTLGSGTAAPGSFGLSDLTTGLNAITIGTDARTQLYSLENTPIGNLGISSANFTNVTARSISNSTVGLGTSSEISIAANAAQYKQTLLKTGTAIRWSYGSNSTAESGSNAGSDFVMARWNDAGGYIQDVFGITRSTGNVTWYEHNNTFRYNGIGTTSTTALEITNDSTATGGAAQWSPALHFKGDAWLSGSSTRANAHWKAEIQTPSAALGTNNLVFSSDISDSPSYVPRLTMSRYGLTSAAGISQKNVFNVRTYGAAGDGVTVDTTAISDAITAAKAVNGTVYFPAGTYMTALITITGASGLTICGDGIGVSILKTTSASQVLNVSSSNHINVYGLTFNGSCTTRTAGQQAVVFDASYSKFCDNEIINSGEYAFFAGSGSTQITDLIVSRNLVRACYADGINFQYVTRSLISDNIVDGSDDDCIALGYNGTGVTTFVNVVGNYCRSRTDLGTSWGRGILVERATDCQVIGNFVEGIKQTGIYVNGAGSRAYRNRIIGNTVTNAAINSGASIVAAQTTDCVFEGNILENQTGGGSMFDIADWQNLKILGGSITQNVNVFTRGIHAEEGSGWAASWDNLLIKGVAIAMTGASTNNCVYLNPHSSVTMNTVVVEGVVGRQVVAGDYITVGSARVGTLAKLINNTTMSAGNTVSTGGIIAVANNN